MSEARKTVIIPPGFRSGEISIPASKSRAHRLLICAALSRDGGKIICNGVSNDIRATVDCLRAMGAEINFSENPSRFEIVRPLPQSQSATSEGGCLLPCGESGSTLRFLLPVLGALGISAAFRMEGRLPERPMQPLTDVLSAHGMHIRKEGSLLICNGQLQPGMYSIPGNVSSQYISGLLFALPLLPGNSILKVTETVESSDYIAMTEDALRLSGFHLEKHDWEYRISGGQTGSFPGSLAVESDWSSAAFFLCLGALSPLGISVRGMNPASVQGDRAILPLLAGFGARVVVDGDTVHVCRGSLKGREIDASAVPDLVPVISVVASAASGKTVIRRAERLRLKESDRLKSTASMLSGLGADIHETEDGLILGGLSSGKSAPVLSGGEVSSFLDHRIAMSAAVAASICRMPVTVLDAQCTDKSFPGFWDAYFSLDRNGGSV